ncbi:hypothetical protein [Methanosphaera sp.]
MDMDMEPVFEYIYETEYKMTEDIRRHRKPTPKPLETTISVKTLVGTQLAKWCAYTINKTIKELGPTHHIKVDFSDVEEMDDYFIEEYWGWNLVEKDYDITVENINISHKLVPPIAEMIMFIARDCLEGEDLLNLIREEINLSTPEKTIYIEELEKIIHYTTKNYGKANYLKFIDTLNYIPPETKEIRLYHYSSNLTFSEAYQITQEIDEMDNIAKVIVDFRHIESIDEDFVRIYFNWFTNYALDYDIENTNISHKFIPLIGEYVQKRESSYSTGPRMVNSLKELLNLSMREEKLFARQLEKIMEDTYIYYQKDIIHVSTLLGQTYYTKKDAQKLIQKIIEEDENKQIIIDFENCGNLEVDFTDYYYMWTRLENKEYNITERNIPHKYMSIIYYSIKKLENENNKEIWSNEDENTYHKQYNKSMKVFHQYNSYPRYEKIDLTTTCKNLPTDNYISLRKLFGTYPLTRKHANILINKIKEKHDKHIIIDFEDIWEVEVDFAVTYYQWTKIEQEKYKTIEENISYTILPTLYYSLQVIKQYMKYNEWFIIDKRHETWQEKGVKVLPVQDKKLANELKENNHSKTEWNLKDIYGNYPLTEKHADNLIKHIQTTADETIILDHENITYTTIEYVLKISDWIFIDNKKEINLKNHQFLDDFTRKLVYYTHPLTHLKLEEKILKNDIDYIKRRNKGLKIVADIHKEKGITIPLKSIICSYYAEIDEITSLIEKIEQLNDYYNIIVDFENIIINDNFKKYFQWFLNLNNTTLNVKNINILDKNSISEVYTIFMEITSIRGEKLIKILQTTLNIREIELIKIMKEMHEYPINITPHNMPREIILNRTNAGQILYKKDAEKLIETMAKHIQESKKTLNINFAYAENLTLDFIQLYYEWTRIKQNTKHKIYETKFQETIILMYCTLKKLEDKYHVNLWQFESSTYHHFFNEKVQELESYNWHITHYNIELNPKIITISLKQLYQNHPLTKYHAQHLIKTLQKYQNKYRIYVDFRDINEIEMEFALRYMRYSKYNYHNPSIHEINTNHNILLQLYYALEVVKSEKKEKSYYYEHFTKEAMIKNMEKLEEIKSKPYDSLLEYYNRSGIDIDNKTPPQWIELDLRLIYGPHILTKAHLNHILKIISETEIKKIYVPLGRTYDSTSFVLELMDLAKSNENNYYDIYVSLGRSYVLTREHYYTITYFMDLKAQDKWRQKHDRDYILRREEGINKLKEDPLN